MSPVAQIHLIRLKMKRDLPAWPGGGKKKNCSEFSSVHN